MAQNLFFLFKRIVKNAYVKIGRVLDSGQVSSDIPTVDDKSPENNELVLITAWTFGSGVGSFIPFNYDVINQMIKDVDTKAGIDTGYQLTPIDLSGFIELV